MGSNTGVKLHRLAVKPPQQDQKSLNESSSKRSKNFFLLGGVESGQQQDPQVNSNNVPDAQAERPVLITKMRNSDLTYTTKKRSIFSVSKQQQNQGGYLASPYKITQNTPQKSAQSVYTNPNSVSNEGLQTLNQRLNNLVYTKKRGSTNTESNPAQFRYQDKYLNDHLTAINSENQYNRIA